MSTHRNLDIFLVEAEPIPRRLRRSDTGDASGSNSTDVNPNEHYFERIRRVEAELKGKVHRMECEIVDLDSKRRNLGVRYEQLRTKYEMSVSREASTNAYADGVLQDSIRLGREQEEQIRRLREENDRLRRALLRLYLK